MTYGVIGWGALLGSAAAAMALVMQINEDPTASTVNTVVFGCFAAAFVALDVALLKPLFRPARSDGAAGSPALGR